MSENQDFTALSGSNVEIEAFGVPGTTGHFAAPLAHPPTVRMAHEAFWIAAPPRDKDLHVGFVWWCLAAEGASGLELIERNVIIRERDK